MRTYGRISNPDGTRTWVEVQTDAQGNNDLVMLTTLCQCLQLSKNESPFYASYGISAMQSIMQQVAPDYDMSVMQQQFAAFFASLTITKTVSSPPTYSVNVITHSGVPLGAQVAI